MVSMIEPSIGEVIDKAVHDEDLAQHADQQRGADQLANVRPLDLFGLLPQQRHERKERRGDRATPETIAIGWT